MLGISFYRAFNKKQNKTIANLVWTDIFISLCITLHISRSIEQYFTTIYSVFPGDQTLRGEHVE